MGINNTNHMYLLPHAKYHTGVMFEAILPLPTLQLIYVDQ